MRRSRSTWRGAFVFWRPGRSSWRDRPRSFAATSRFVAPTSATEGGSLETLLHQIFSGLANGGVYALLALALVMIYQTTHLVNFAQGEMAMLSTYMASAMVNAGVSYWVAFLATLLVSFFAAI